MADEKSVDDDSPLFSSLFRALGICTLWLAFSSTKKPGLPKAACRAWMNVNKIGLRAYLPFRRLQ